VSASAGLKPLGGPCYSTANCQVGLRCELDGTGLIGGVCSTTCASASCPALSTCTDLRSTPVNEKVCLQSCSATTCGRPGYTCCATLDKVCVPAALCPAAVAASSTPPRACTLPSTPLLRAGGTAGPTTAPPGCIRPTARSLYPAAQRLELGNHGIGEEVGFTLPSGAGSLSIVQQATNGRPTMTYKGKPLANTVMPLRIRRPDGTLLYDDLPAPPADLSTASAYYATAAPTVGAFTVPNTSAALAGAATGAASPVLPAGDWSVTINDFANQCLYSVGCEGGSSLAHYDVTVLWKPPAPATGRIDLSFYLVGVQDPATHQPLTAANAVAASSVQQMVRTAATLLGQAGLCLGSATFYDVPAWIQTRYATGLAIDDRSPCSNLSQLFTTSKADGTLPFFLVSSFSDSTIVGVDGTIPGPSSLGGTVHSGAAVSGADLNANLAFCSATGTTALFNANCGPDNVAYIVAHEAGHWLGLYHSTERTGQTFDPVADTATCRCEDCTSVSRRLGCGGTSSTGTSILATDCTSAGATCGGSDNLMFWELRKGVSRGVLTDQQSRILRANPLVR
jgi:hypothetical protein